MTITQQKTTQIGVRIDPATREKLQQAADREGRTLSDMARRILAAALRRRFLPPADALAEFAARREEGQ